MLWKFLVAVATFLTRPFHGPPVNETPYDVTSFGPRSWSEAHIASQALQGKHDDMRFPNHWNHSAGIKDERFRWPGYPGRGVVPYEIDESLKPINGKIQEAMQQYHQHTCIRFVKRTNERNYIRLIQQRGCWSYVGRIGGVQQVSLGRGCWYVGTIVHELGHAVGLYHEHQRSDRDQYLNVYTQNVISGQTHNFQKTPENQEIKGGKYDYASIMHYGNYAFSKQPGRLATMVAKNGTPLKEPYEKPGLNHNDIQLVKTLYKCQ